MLIEDIALFPGFGSHCYPQSTERFLRLKIETIQCIQHSVPESHIRNLGLCQLQEGNVKFPWREASQSANVEAAISLCQLSWELRQGLKTVFTNGSLVHPSEFFILPIRIEKSNMLLPSHHVFCLHQENKQWHAGSLVQTKSCLPGGSAEVAVQRSRKSPGPQGRGARGRVRAVSPVGWEQQQMVLHFWVTGLHL